MPEGDSKQPKFRRRAEARPDEVLDAALSLFARQGYAKTKVEQVARRAGVSKGAVYLYFPSKEAILEGLVRRTIDPITRGVFEGMHGYRGDPRPLIAQFLRRVSGVMAGDQTRLLPVIIVGEAATAPGVAELFRNTVLDQALPAITALLRQGVEGGYIRAVDPEMTARTIIGPLLAHLLLSELFGVCPEGGLQMDRLVENHLSILWAGLAPAGEAA